MEKNPYARTGVWGVVRSKGYSRVQGWGGERWSKNDEFERTYFLDAPYVK